MSKQIRFSNPDLSSIKTSLATDSVVDSNNIIVNDGGVFVVGDLILFEEHGHEYNEMNKIIDINGNILTLESNIMMPHNKGADIIKVNYDKYKIEVSNDNSSYSLLTEGDINYADTFDAIVFNDIDGTDKKYYRITYINSSTNDELIGKIVHNELLYSYMTVDEFRAETGFLESEVTDTEILNALANGVDWIRDNAYNSVVLNASGQDYVFNLDLNGMVLADNDANGVIDKYDIVVYEYDNYNKTRIYVNHLVNNVIVPSQKIIFKEKLPRDGRELTIIPTATFKTLPVILDALKTINKLIATNWILMNVRNNKIRNGITNWSAGGTSVSRDMSSISDSVEKNLAQASNVLEQIAKIYIHRSKLRVSNTKKVRTPGGMWI